MSRSRFFAAECFQPLCRQGRILLLVASFCVCAIAADAAELERGDCGKCHSEKVRALTAAGGPHATEVGCLDCHPHHPPRSGTAFRACNECHQSRPHYEIDGCRHCHTDPHQPLVSLRDPLKPMRRECLSCHPEVGRQMNENPSRHGELYCTRCHSRHKEVSTCLDCHEPHLANQTNPDCGTCHPTHAPLRIVPAGHVPSRFCQVCHAQVARDLAATKTNHGGITCLYCHQGPHRSIPECQACHGLPHAQAIHRQHRGCRDCHGGAHRLISNR